MNKNVPQLRFPEFTGEWEEKRLGDIFNFQYGQLNNNPDNGGKYPIYGANGIIGGYTEYNAEDSIVIGHIANAGSVIWGEGKHFVTYNGTITKSKNRDFLNKYGYFMLLGLRISDISNGSGQSFVSYSTLTKIKCKSTLNTEEQTKIADFLSTLDSRITVQTEKVEILEKIKKGYMQRIFSQELRFKRVDGSEYPDWEEKRLGELGEFYRGHSYSKENVKATGLLVLRSNNIQERGIDVSEGQLQFVNKKCKESIILKTGDVAICMANGSKRLVGKSAEYKNEYDGTATVGAFCSIFRGKNALGKTIFKTKRYEDYIQLALEGTNINNLKNSVLEGLIFNIPSDTEEQTKIADFLSTLDTKIEVERKMLETLQGMKKGFLQKMFI